MATTNSVRQCSIVSYGIDVTIEIRCYKHDMLWSLRPAHYKLATARSLQSAHLQTHYNMATTQHGHYNLAITQSLRICYHDGHYELLQLGHYNPATTNLPLRSCHNPGHYEFTTT